MSQFSSYSGFIGSSGGGGGVTSVTASPPLSSSGGATPNISETQADTSTDGYLSSIDWNTFNGKQASGNYITALTGDVTATGPGSVLATLKNIPNKVYVDFISGSDSNTGTLTQPWKTLQHAYNSISPSINTPYVIYLSGGNNSTDSSPITGKADVSIIADYIIQVPAITITSPVGNSNGCTFANITFLGAVTWIRTDGLTSGATFINCNFFSGPVIKNTSTGTCSVTGYNSQFLNSEFQTANGGFAVFNDCTFFGTTTFDDPGSGRFSYIQFDGGYSSGAMSFTGLYNPIYFTGFVHDVAFGASVSFSAGIAGPAPLEIDSNGLPPTVTGTPGTITYLSQANNINGVLSVAHGGTNKSSWTAGSIAFAGAGGTALSEDTGFPFSWDNTNKRLNVGAPGTGKVNITSAGGTDLGLNVFSTAANNAAQVQNQSGYSLALVNAASSALVGASIGGAFSRGTLAARTQSLAGDQLFSLTSQGYTGSAFGPGFSAAISFLATENTTATHNGGSLVFSTTPNGSLTPVPAMTIGQNGVITVANLSASLPVQTDASKNLISAAITLSGSQVTGTLPIGNGGTGQVTANAALNALLPSQGGNSGKFLTTNGTNTSWATPTAGAAGSDTQVQFNDSGAFGANAGFVFDKSTVTLSLLNSGAATLIMDGLINTGANGPSINVNGRKLLDAAGNTSVDYSRRILDDNTGNGSILWQLRALADTSSNTLFNWSTPGLVQSVDAHYGSIQSNTTVTIAAQSGAGTGASATVSNATDVAGKMELVLGSAAFSTGAQVTVTFGVPYSIAPIILLTPNNATAGINLGQYYVTSTVNDFTVNFATAALATATYDWFYQVIQTQ